MQVKLFPVEGGHGGADPAIVKEFIEFARNGGKTNTNPVAARNAVAAGVMGAQSIRDNSNSKVVPTLDPELIAYFENGQQ